MLAEDVRPQAEVLEDIDEALKVLDTDEELRLKSLKLPTQSRPPEHVNTDQQVNAKGKQLVISRALMIQSWLPMSFSPQATALSSQSSQDTAPMTSVRSCNYDGTCVNFGVDEGVRNPVHGRKEKVGEKPDPRPGE